MQTVHVNASHASRQDTIPAPVAIPSHVLKKKIAIVAFGVSNPREVADMENIGVDLPSTLMGRLEESGEFLPIYVNRMIPSESGPMQIEAVMRIANESTAQFLVSGNVVNATVGRGDGIFGTTFFAKKYRRLDIEFSVFDGATGTRILTRRLGESAQGDAMMEAGKPFGSHAFFETEFGRAADRLLKHTFQEIKGFLDCQPLSAHIVKIEGNSAFLDAGETSRLAQGGKLFAYASSSYPSIYGLAGDMLGAPEHDVASAMLTDIQAQFSRAEFSDDVAKLGIRVGDRVKFEPASDQQSAAQCSR